MSLYVKSPTEGEITLDWADKSRGNEEDESLLALQTAVVPRPSGGCCKISYLAPTIAVTSTLLLYGGMTLVQRLGYQSLWALAPALLSTVPCLCGGLSCVIANSDDREYSRCEKIVQGVVGTATLIASAALVIWGFTQVPPSDVELWGGGDG